MRSYTVQGISTARQLGMKVLKVHGVHAWCVRHAPMGLHEPSLTHVAVLVPRSFQLPLQQCDVLARWAYENDRLKVGRRSSVNARSKHTGVR